MNNKKIIIIGIIACILIFAIALMLLSSANYERIDITPNGTSIEVPVNKTEYVGELEGIKIWKMDNGALITYNDHEGINSFQLTNLSFNAIQDIIKKGEMQNIDGFTCYVLNADELLEVHLFDIIKVNYNGKLYFIPLNNETTQDNIIIFSNDQDMALHMAKSVQYKNVYPNATSSDNSNITMEQIAEDLLSNTSINI